MQMAAEVVDELLDLARRLESIARKFEEADEAEKARTAMFYADYLRESAKQVREAAVDA